ncbi:recombination associated protein [Pandoraea morbifera]|uniref:Recombination-associated protein RdgC n=1 Tax=Pandoraea morbifera TaxID=2508300 RepID=A0A5E4YS04_9BURK|nr:recombination-associated protein RdgC [Pandoraea morbifera]VVE51277.1 recombination associated protein [Pandoraea morbifera]
MWFRNLQIFRISEWTLSNERLLERLQQNAFRDPSAMEMHTAGWCASRDGEDLAHIVNRQILLVYRTEKKLLPASVVNQVTRAKAVDLEEQQGFKPGRKQMRELREQVIDELMPRAFGIRRDTRLWVDPANRWLIVDAASTAKAHDAIGFLLKTIDIGIANVQLNEAPVAVMTSWLAANESPAGFSIDQDVELRSNANEKAAVRYVHLPLDGDDIRRHIQSGKRSTRLAMTWNDRISFVLTDAFTIKRVTPLDILKEAADPTAESEAERFDADFLLMAGELLRLISDLIEAVGGERTDEHPKLC